MKVLDILILCMGFNTEGNAVRGDVRFMIEEPAGGSRSLTMQCECPASKRIRPDALLVGEAIRQLRRMPEIRSGQNRLEFAKGLKPLQYDRAA